VAGQPVTFTSNVSGGTFPFTYEWDLDADGIVDCTTATCTKTYAAAFNGNVVLTVTDRYGCQAAAFSAPVSVAAAAPSSGGGGGGGGGCFLSMVALDSSKWFSHGILALSLAGMAIAAIRNRQ